MVAQRLAFTVDVLSGEFEKRMERLQTPIARAATAAITRAAADVKAEGRANIGAAGFSTKWQNAFRVTVYPQRSISIDAAAWIYHRIQYAGVFEEGATIQGKPMLWLPLPNLPKRLGRNRFSPQNVQKQVGDLVPMESSSGTPLLGRPIRMSKTQADSPSPKVTLAALRRGNTGKGVLRTVPLFHGVRITKVPKKFSISDVVRRAHEDLPRLYNQYLKDEPNG